MRQSQKFNSSSIDNFKIKALNWGNSSSHFNYFNNNEQSYPNTAFKNIMAVGAHRIIEFKGDDDFETLKKYQQKHNDWLIGYLGYDLKNQIEDLESNNVDLTQFPDIYFYQPEHIILFENDDVFIESFQHPENIYNEIESFEFGTEQNPTVTISELQEEISRNEYIEIIKQLRNHIEEGDIYELNFCMGFHGEASHFNSLTTFQNLITNSPTPFSVYQKIDDHYLLCASPERFLKKEGNKLITQPIKGTAKRGNTPEEDEKQAHALKNSEKERAENMMIFDLVRNDLARSCKAGSVKVEEMFGIYPFKHLFQMISTVTGELKKDVHFIDAIKNAFPMGSMTGAPKIKVMELIEKYEKNKRGLFSGAVGYIAPDQDFDFNVVIRSIFYNAATEQLSFQAGSAITYDSDPEQEYEECMLKVKAIIEVLNFKNSN